MNGAIEAGVIIAVIGALVIAVGVGVSIKFSKGDTQLQSLSIPGSAATGKTTVRAGVFLVAVGVVLIAGGSIGNFAPHASAAVTTPGSSPAVSTDSAKSVSTAPISGLIVSGNDGLAAGINYDDEGNPELGDEAPIFANPSNAQNTQTELWDFVRVKGPDASHAYYHIIAHESEGMKPASAMASISSEQGNFKIQLEAASTSLEQIWWLEPAQDDDGYFLIESVPGGCLAEESDTATVDDSGTYSSLTAYLCDSSEAVQLWQIPSGLADS